MTSIVDSCSFFIRKKSFILVGVMKMDDWTLKLDDCAHSLEMKTQDVDQ
jgi:hypothetical protein